VLVPVEIISNLEFGTWKFPDIKVRLFLLNLQLIFSLDGDPLLSSARLGTREHKHCPGPRRSVCLLPLAEYRHSKPKAQVPMWFQRMPAREKFSPSVLGFQLIYFFLAFFCKAVAFVFILNITTAFKGTNLRKTQKVIILCSNQVTPHFIEVLNSCL